MIPELFLLGALVVLLLVVSALGYWRLYRARVRQRRQRRQWETFNTWGEPLPQEEAATERDEAA